jgi:hypothetical protein
MSEHNLLSRHAIPDVIASKYAWLANPHRDTTLP